MNAKHRKIIIVALLGGCLISCSLISCSKDEMKGQQLEIRSQLESAVTDIDREIDRIRRQTEITADTTKEKLERQLDKLDDVRKNLKDNLEKIGDTTADNWGEFRRAVDRSLEHAEQAVKDAREDMSR